MKSKVVIVLSISVVVALLLASFAVAAENVSISESSDKVEKAYKCLEDKVKASTQLGFQEAVFTVLAIGGKSNALDRIDADKDTMASCWPKNGCKIKETAMAALAYQRVGKDTSEIKKWLLSKNVSAPDLKWFLQIDIAEHGTADCTIKYDEKTNNIKIGEDMKIRGSPGSCLAIDNQGYMLRINNNCLRKEFEISCNTGAGNFVTSIVYQRGTGGTLFVMPESHSAASLGATKETATGDCFKTETSCDYEGSLWATLALQNMKESTMRFNPYLLALAEDNARYFPSAFLYILTGGDEQYNIIVQEQEQGKFWEMTGTKEGRFYDTSLAMLALSGKNAAELDNAKSYLLSVQTNDGCWNNNNIRDTAFILYSGWSKSVQGVTPNTPTACEPQFSCEKGYLCSSSGGQVLYDYACNSAGELCCSIKVGEQPCSQKGGLICTSTQTCQGGVIESASDGSCCVGGSCIEMQTPQEDTCTSAGGTCAGMCEEGEEESMIETCSSSEHICCMKKGSSLWIWIILLLILIGLVVAGIIYRDKVKIWWFKTVEFVKVKMLKKKGAVPATPQRTPMPQQRAGAPYAPYGRPMLPPAQRAPIARPMARPPVKSRDKEMEDALRKLREMSK